MEYAPYKGLDELIRHYTDQNLFIPEPFIWLVFSQLATTCLDMEEKVKDNVVGGEQENIVPYGESGFF